MSYILDALKKAAEQREAHAPAVRRLFSSPTPDVGDSPRWRLALVGGAAAVVGAVIAIWALWPTSTPVRVQAEAPPVVQPMAPARSHLEPAPIVPAPPPTPVVVRPTPPKPPAPAKAVTEKRAAPTALQTRPPDPAESAPTPAPAAPAPPVTAAARPTPIPATTPTPAATAPRTDGSGQMRLEVIVYSDERARRLAFINGRKYVEGDVLLDGSKIQEIQPNAVVIVDDGRRVVLRP